MVFHKVLAVAMLGAACHCLSLPAYAADADYVSATAPAALRGKITVINGVRTFIQENGYYSLVLEDDTEAQLDEGAWVFTYAPGDMSEVKLIIDVVDGVAPVTMDDIQANVEDMFTPMGAPAFLKDIKVTAHHTITLPGKNGKKDVTVPVWYGAYKSLPDVPAVFAMINLPTGYITIAGSAAWDDEDVDRVLAEYFQLADGILQ